MEGEEIPLNKIFCQWMKFCALYTFVSLAVPSHPVFARGFWAPQVALEQTVAWFRTANLIDSNRKLQASGRSEVSNKKDVLIIIYECNSRYCSTV